MVGLQLGFDSILLPENRLSATCRVKKRERPSNFGCLCHELVQRLLLIVPEQGALRGNPKDFPDLPQALPGIPRGTSKFRKQIWQAWVARGSQLLNVLGVLDVLNKLNVQNNGLTKFRIDFNVEQIAFSDWNPINSESEFLLIVLCFL